LIEIEEYINERKYPIVLLSTIIRTKEVIYEFIEERHGKKKLKKANTHKNCMLEYRLLLMS
jgi:hypothetical protein